MNKKAYIKYLQSRKSSNKTNYYIISKKEVEEIKKKYGDKKPTILVHACCAVCASWPLEFLSSIFDVTVYYNNSNIWPADEYNRRLDELKRYIKETNENIKLIITKYDNENYTQKLEPMKDYPEGWGRCFYCYSLRMKEAYEYAAKNKFIFFTTVMSISRQKDSQIINGIGKSLSQFFPSVKYFYSDFKKGGGQERQKQLVDEHNLYRQDYCGCIYSYKERHKI